MDKQAMQLHDKVQILIEQYTKDKKRLAELEAIIKERSDDSQGLAEEIHNLTNQLQTAQKTNEKLTSEISELITKNQELEKVITTFESFADDLTTQIDDIIPQIEKL